MIPGRTRHARCCCGPGRRLTASAHPTAQVTRPAGSMGPRPSRAPSSPRGDVMLTREDFKLTQYSLVFRDRVTLDINAVVRGVRYHFFLQQTTAPDPPASAEDLILHPATPFVYKKPADRGPLSISRLSSLKREIVPDALQHFSRHYPLWRASAWGSSAAFVMNTAHDEGFFNGFPCRRQLVTVDGVMTVVDPAYYGMLSFAKPLSYVIPGLPVIFKERIIVSDGLELSAGIFRVRLDGTVLAMKTIYRYNRTRADEFVREACVLAALPPHPHVVAFHGLVAARHGRVDAMLLDFIDGHPLRQQRHATPAQRLRWKEQLRSALAHLHGQQPPVIWVDAKVDNVMVTRAGDAVLFDFGGGFSGFVDKHLNGTIAGDQQGMKIVTDWIDELPEPSTVDVAGSNGDGGGNLDGGDRQSKEVST